MKVIASDFDGTLCRRGKIAKTDRQAVSRWRAAGNRFGVVTGRDLHGALEVLRHYRIAVDFLICCTGAIITDGKFRVLDETRGDCRALPDLIRCTLPLSPGYFHTCQYDRVLYLSEAETTDVSFAHPASPEEMAALDGFHQTNVCFATDGEARDYVADVNARFGTALSAFQNGRFVDIPPAGCSKTAGIARYLSLIGAPLSAVTTIGDNDNDIDMLRAYHGAAVSRAKPAVKAAASAVCESVAAWIEMQMNAGDV